MKKFPIDERERKSFKVSIVSSKIGPKGPFEYCDIMYWNHLWKIDHFNHLLHDSSRASRASRRLVAFRRGGLEPDFLEDPKPVVPKPVSPAGPSENPLCLLSSLTFLCETAFNLKQRSLREASSFCFSSTPMSNFFFSMPPLSSFFFSLSNF